MSHKNQTSHRTRNPNNVDQWTAGDFSNELAGIEEYLHRESKPNVMDRIRRAARTRLGKAAIALTVVSGAAGVAGGVSAAVHSHGHEATPRPAATSSANSSFVGNSSEAALKWAQGVAKQRGEVATRQGRATLEREKSRLQSASMSSARTILKDIADSSIAPTYHGDYVSTLPGRVQSPQMYAQWIPRTNTLEVASITQPDGGAVDTFNNVVIDFRIEDGHSVAVLNRAVKDGDLSVGTFESALNRGNAEVASVRVQTPEEPNASAIAVSGDGSMSFAHEDTYGSVTVTDANAGAIVDPFIGELKSTTNALQGAFRSYEQ